MTSQHYSRRKGGAAAKSLGESFRPVSPKNYRTYFKKGRVIRILWPEPASSIDPQSNDIVTIDTWREDLVVKIHWFMVVQPFKSHCLVVSVNTYEGRGATKSGVSADDHCALVAKGHDQVLQDGETLAKAPLQLIVEDPLIRLKSTSRINFTKTHTVEYNVKVSTVGRIAPEDVKRMESYWQEAISKVSMEEPKYLEFVERKQAALDQLAIINYQAQQSRLISQRVPKTGQWFIQSPEYQDWLNSREGGILFCPGTPGAGKTMTASIVVEHLLNEFQGDSDIRICYAFGDYQSPQKHNLSHVLASILKQLVQNHPALLSAAASDLDGSNGLDSAGSLADELWNAFSIFANHSSKTFIVVDALDEFNTPGSSFKQLCSGIFELRQQCSKPVHVFATSRFIPEITKLFEQYPRKEIHAQAEDVGNFLDSQMNRLPDFVTDSVELQNEIKSDILKAVDGSFLFARSFMNDLAEKISLRDIRNALKSSTTTYHGLDIVHQTTMSRIDRHVDQHISASRVLMWITCARRPLTASELQHALAMESEQQLDLENVPRLEDLLSICAGLVTIDNGSGCFRLVHRPTQNFLSRVQEERFPDAQEIITKTCIAYMSMEGLQRVPTTTDDRIETIFQSYPFYAYAVQYWGDHARLSTASTSTSISKMVKSFVESKDHIQAASYAIFAPNSALNSANTRHLVDEKVTALHLMAYFGCDNLMSDLIDVHTVDIEDSHRRTPLSYAASGGHVNALEILLKNKASIDASDNKEQTALWYSMHYQNEASARLLLEKGARWNICDKEHGHSTPSCDRTALIWAAKLGSLELVQRLLEKGAKPDAKDADGGRTALIWAAKLGSQELVRRLLKNGAKPNATDADRGRTALIWAAKGGLDTIVELLLERKAETEIRDSYGQTALSWAARRGFGSVARLLIDKGAVCNVKDNYGQSPLWWASRRGFTGIVRLLLAAKNIDIEAQDDGQGRSALSWAAENGFEFIVNALLDRGASVRSKSKAGQTPLFFAANAGHLTIVQLLCHHGADIEAQDTYGQKPVSRAARRKHQEIESHLSGVRWRSSECADIRNHRLPLQAPRGPKETYDWLLDDVVNLSTSGASHNSTDGGFIGGVGHDTVLRLLNIQEGRQVTVRLLFSYDNSSKTGYSNRGVPAITPSYQPDNIHNESTSVLLQPLDSRLAREYDHPDYFKQMSHSTVSVVLTNALLDKNEILGMRSESKDLHHSSVIGAETIVQLLQKFARTLQPDHFHRAKLFNDLGVLLANRHKKTGNLDDLKNAISNMKAAEDALDQALNESSQAQRVGHAHDIRRVVVLVNLGIQLDQKFRITWLIADLEEAIKKIRQAMNATLNTSDWCRLVHILGVQLSERYAILGAQVDLEEAIRITEQAIEKEKEQRTTTRSGRTPELLPRHSDLRGALKNNLGSLFGDRFKEAKDPRNLSDSDKAIKVMRQAIDEAPDYNLSKGILLNNLGSLYADRYAKTKNKQDFDNAKECMDDAIVSFPDSCADQAIVYSNIGILLGVIHRSSEVDFLQEAIRAAQAAQKAIPPNYPGRPGVLYNLGSLLAQDYLKTKNDGLLQEAVFYMHEGLKETLETHPDPATMYRHRRSTSVTDYAFGELFLEIEGFKSISRWYFKPSIQSALDRALDHTITAFDMKPYNENAMVPTVSESPVLTSTRLNRLTIFVKDAFKEDLNVVIKRGLSTAAAGNAKNGGKILELMGQMLSDEGKFTTKMVTAEVLKSAASNAQDGEEILRRLLDLRDPEVKITSEVVKAAARNGWNGDGILKLLLDRCQGEISITEEVFRAAAGNLVRGDKVMSLLLEHQQGDIPLTEGIVRVAAGNEVTGNQILSLLLDHCGQDKITRAQNDVNVKMVDLRPQGTRQAIMPVMKRYFENDFEKVGEEKRFKKLRLSK